MSLFDDLPRPFFAMAPLDDVSDTVFRRTIASCAKPDVFFTEFVNVDGLNSPGRQKLFKRLVFEPSERPLIAQLWGLKPENFEVIATQMADGSLARELGLPEGVNFDGIDLNMGCPEKTVVKNGACSALIKNPDLAVEIIQATQRGVAGRMPVSVKTRLGFNEIDFSWHELLLQQKLNMLTIHGRTRKEMSKVDAHWDAIAHIVELRDKIAPNTIIVGNGDVINHAHGLELAKQSGVDGIMIGRGVFHDPYAFAADSPWESVVKEDRIALYRRQVQLFADTWKDNERPIQTLNKFCKIYINGFDGAKEMREQLMAAKSAEELLDLLSVES